LRYLISLLVENQFGVLARVAGLFSGRAFIIDSPILRYHVKMETAPHKYPREIEFIEVLPKAASGKIKRTELRKMEVEKRGESMRDV
jgi:acyl-CoA synthetase (AMP-forming)/AMP-acid ligase II